MRRVEAAAKRFVWGLRPVVRRSTAACRRLEGMQRLSSEATRREQRKALERLLLHASAHVPYYRRVLAKAGVVEPGEERVDLERFAAVPLLDKEILRSRFEELKSDDLGRRKWFYNTSGGSTGEPARFIGDLESHVELEGAGRLMDSWTGYRTGERRLLLWGSERDIFVGRETAKVRLARRLKNEVWLNAFRMSWDDMRRFIEAIDRFRPVQILAYAESIYELARFAERERLRPRPPGSILASAGTLHPFMRRKIEEVFRAPVFNRYGSREVGPTACECERREGLHVCPFTHYMEVLRPDGTAAGPGEEGEVFVTLLTNRALPLIRYRIGDRAAWAVRPCSCGRSWPLLERVSGRVTDSFIDWRGGLVNGEYFTHLVYYRDWVGRFQFRQTAPDLVKVFITPAARGDVPENHADEIREMTGKIRRALGEKCRVEFSFVEEIPPAPSGKYRYTISEVPRCDKGGAD